MFAVYCEIRTSRSALKGHSWSGAWKWHVGSPCFRVSPAGRVCHNPPLKKRGILTLK